MGLLSIEQGANAVRADFAFYGAALLGLLALADLGLRDGQRDGWPQAGLWLLSGQASRPHRRGAWL